jgi:Flp pilus assembly protein TadG
MGAITACVRRYRRNDDGAELIEMALITPVLLLILAGIFDFGFLFRSWEAVTNAARGGARVGVLPAYGCADGGPAEARVSAYLTASGLDAPAAGEVVPTVVTFATPAGTISACQVTISVTQQLPSLGVFGAFFGDGLTSVSLNATSTMRSEVQVAPGI